MAFFQKPFSSIKTKKQQKVTEKVTEIISKNQYDEIRSFIPSLKKEDENTLIGFDKAIQECLQNDSFHRSIFELYQFFLSSRSASLFRLYYESLLFNPELYHLLKTEYQYEDENTFDTFLIYTAEDFEGTEAKNYALGVLAMLKDSFLAKEEIKKDEKDQKK